MELKVVFVSTDEDDDSELDDTSELNYPFLDHNNNAHDNVSVNTSGNSLSIDEAKQHQIS